MADAERTEKTICLTVSPSLKTYGISGGAYVPVCGRVKKVDGYRREIVLKDGTALPMGNIIAMEGDVFGNMED